MNKIAKTKVDKLIHSIALEYNMSDEEMKNLLYSPYEFAHSKIKELNLDNIRSEEELEKVKTNFLFRSFFKLVIRFRSIKARNSRADSISKSINNK